MSELAGHHCPVCGHEQRAFPRYPWYICKSCRLLAEDASGARLEFGNAGFSGGLVMRRAGEEGWSDEVGRVLCLILGRPVLVTEARFGGVVAQPWISGPAPSDVLDLTRDP